MEMLTSRKFVVYRAVSGSNWTEFENNVTEALGKDWLLYGPTIVLDDHFAQPMVREKRPRGRRDEW